MIFKGILDLDTVFWIRVKNRIQPKNWIRIRNTGFYSIREEPPAWISLHLILILQIELQLLRINGAILVTNQNGSFIIWIGKPQKK